MEHIRDRGVRASSRYRGREDARMAAHDDAVQRWPPMQERGHSARITDANAVAVDARRAPRGIAPAQFVALPDRHGRRRVADLPAALRKARKGMLPCLPIPVECIEPEGEYRRSPVNVGGSSVLRAKTRGPVELQVNADAPQVIQTDDDAMPRVR